MQKSIIYSHGFGTDKTSRGLLSGIADSLPDYQHHLFDYNTTEDSGKILTVSSLTASKALLQAETAKVSGEKHLIGHSQGCLVAGMLAPDDFTKIILLAPPTDMRPPKQRVASMLQREGAYIQDDGSVMYPRRDGTTTIVTKDYLGSTIGVEPITLYNQLSLKADVTVVKAAQDEVLKINTLTGLSSVISVVEIEAGHDFKGMRDELNNVISSILTF